MWTARSGLSRDSTLKSIGQVSGMETGSCFSHRLPLPIQPPFPLLLLLLNSLFDDLFSPMTQWLSLFNNKSQKGGLNIENFIKMIVKMTS